MIMEYEFSIEDKPKIFPCIFGCENLASKWTKIKREQIEVFIQSKKIENFKFSMFNDKSKLFEENKV